MFGDWKILYYKDVNSPSYVLKKERWRQVESDSCDPTDCSPPGSSVHGILQARILEWVAISTSRRIFPTQGLNPGLPHSRQTLYWLNYAGSQCNSIQFPGKRLNLEEQQRTKCLTLTDSKVHYKTTAILAMQYWNKKTINRPMEEDPETDPHIYHV